MKSSLAPLLRQFVLVLLLAATPAFFTPDAGAASSTTTQHEQSAAVTTATPNAAAVAAEHGETVGEHAEAHANPLSAEKLKDLFWRTVNFIALLIILVKFLGKPVMNALSGRQQRIANELAEINARREEAERSYTAFTAKLAGMEKEMERVVSQAAAQAEIEKDRILAEAERAAEDIKRQAQAAVQGEMEEAKRKLREEIAEEAAKMAEELIKKNLTAADQKTITEQYLERVGAAL
ncbi:MAG: F0F1 ATP synthase subunit B [Desulfobulbus sp.]|jgi:F-type H+-transporting ATPase subunit b